MISFLNIAFLAAIPLVGVPVVIHLLNRHRRQVIDWGAMRFLEDAAVRQSRMAHLEDLILMLLRALAILLILLALAQPMVRSSWFGGAGRRDVIVVLDRSLSTGTQIDGRTLLDRQKEAALQLIDGLAEGDSVRLLLPGAGGGTDSAWRTSGPVAVNGSTRTQLAAAIRAVEPAQGHADIAQALKLALDAEPAGGQIGGRGRERGVVLLSDGWAAGWNAEAGDAWAQVRTAIEEGEHPATAEAWLAHDAAAPANVAVTRVSASPGVASPGQPVRLEATVFNGGGETSATASLRWRVGERVIGTTPVPAMEAGQEATVHLDHAFATLGAVAVTAELLATDALPGDNVTHAIVEVVESLPVLVMEPDRATGELRSSRLLMAALGAGDDTATEAGVIRPRVIRYADAAATTLDGFRAVVLIDPPADTGALAERLRTYAENGGGVWFMLGDSAEADAFNATWHAGGTGLLPQVTGRGQTQDAEPARLSLPLRPHPAMRVLAGASGLDLDRVELRQMRQLRVDAAGGASVLLSAGADRPFAVESAVGRGRVIVQAAPLELSWSRLAASRAFVVITHEWLWRLAETSGTRFNLTHGEAAQVRLPDASPETRAELLSGAGDPQPMTISGEGVQRIARSGSALAPGLHMVRIESPNAAAREVPFHVARPVEESRLEPLSSAERETIAAASGISFVDRPLQTRSIHDGPREPVSAWTWVLLGLLVLLVAELALGYRINGRRQDTSGGIEFSPDFRAGFGKEAA